ncbi:hypothetical protein, partial [Staphylococcus aureus]|uniref:hypothetical protein n=1 Tax=Staphylococcus aureus TaxID=1280 RepID=UPI0038B3530B
MPLGFTKDGNFAVRDPIRNIMISANPHQLMSQQWLVGLAPSTFWRGRYPTEKGFSSQVASEAL